MNYIGENIITENQVRVLNLFSCFDIKISDNFNKILSKKFLCSTSLILYSIKNEFVSQKSLIQTFHTSFLLKNNLYEFTTQEQKFKW